MAGSLDNGIVKQAVSVCGRDLGSNTHIRLQLHTIERSRWDELISEFDDATIYQTWSYGAVQRRPQDLRHVIVKSGEEVLGGCQLTVRRLRPTGIGVADVKCGPLWRKKGRPANPDIYLQLIREIKQEYGYKQGCFIRIWPHFLGAHQETLRLILENEGFLKEQGFEAYRTLCLDLTSPLDELRKTLLQKWRNCLNKAERSNLRVLEGTSAEFYATFLKLAEEMLARKKFTPGVDYQTFRRLQADLPDPLKMRILVCETDGEPVSVAIYSALGDTGTYLLGATGDKGIGLNGAYLLQWSMITSLKQRGVRCYDLGGIDPIGNPGVYEFKLGIAGKRGFETSFLGQYNGCFNLRARLSQFVLTGARVLSKRIVNPSNSRRS